MKRVNILVLLFLVGLWIAPANTPAQDNSCPSIVQNALAVTDTACERTGRNQTCYGNFRLEAVAQPGFDNILLRQRGDIADVAAISTLALSSMNADAEEWGVALMRIQANLPEALPGQNVTFLLFGDVEIENAVPSNTEPVTFDVTATSNINIRSGPSTNDDILGGLATGEQLLASGRLTDGSWLRVELPDGSVGWVFAELVTSEGEISTLNMVDPSGEETAAPPYGPMQAFYFRSGVGDAPCAEAPDSGILIQTPEGVGEITLVANEVNIALSSTVYLQAQAPGEMTINGIEDQARVGAFNVTRTVVAGTRLRVPLDENRAASGPPGPLEPYDFERLQALPLQNLDRQVPLLPALSQQAITVLPTATLPSPQDTFTDPADDVVRCNTQANANDPEVDIVRLMAGRRSDGGLGTQVYLREPLVNDYSFAVLLIIASRESFKMYLWEIHDGVLRIGEVDPVTGEIIPGSLAVIEHNRAMGIVSFDIPGVELPETIDQIGVRSFHTPTRETQPQPTHCDFAGPYDFVG